MTYIKNSTQVPNYILDSLLKTLSKAEAFILLSVIRRTLGYADPNNKAKRVQRAWMSQKLFELCTGLRGRTISTGIDKLVCKKLIKVTDREGRVLNTKMSRRGATRLCYESCLQLSKTSLSKPCELSGNNPVKKSHTIKLNYKTKSCDKNSQGLKRLSDTRRFEQIQNQLL